jgi:hypothetical protein
MVVSQNPPILTGVSTYSRSEFDEFAKSHYNLTYDSNNNYQT